MQIGGGRGIKSVQRGTLNLGSGVTTGNQTVTSVNMNKSKLELLGQTNTAGSVSDLAVAISLTTSTNIQFSRNTSGSAVLVSWELVEYA